MTATANSIIWWCWIIFFVYWFISAQKVKAVAETQSRSSALWHRLPVIAGWLLLFARHLPAPMNFVLTPREDWARAGGVAVCVLGLCVTIWARHTLAGNWSADVTFKQNHELIKSGPYRFVRHPIYTGLLLMSLGTAIDLGYLRCWLGLLLSGIGFWIKLKQEEKLMLQHFPNDYPVYQKQVKALVPFVI